MNALSLYWRAQIDADSEGIPMGQKPGKAPGMLFLKESRWGQVLRQIAG